MPYASVPLKFGRFAAASLVYSGSPLYWLEQVILLL